MLGASLTSRGYNECVVDRAGSREEEMDAEREVDGDCATSGVLKTDGAASLPSSSCGRRLESERGGGEEPTEDSSRLEETEQSGVEPGPASGSVTPLGFELSSDDDGDEVDAIGVSASKSRAVGEGEEGTSEAPGEISGVPRSAGWF
jgi:hypothetical protein